MNKGVPIAIVVVVLVAIVAVALTYHPSAVSTVTTAPGTAAVPIAMTDPAEVPVNTTSLYISYSSFKIFYFTANGSSNIDNVNVSGSINLLSLVSVSKVLAVASLPLNSSVKSVQFTVVSANATINGTVYSVKVPSSIVTAIIPSNLNKINSSSNLVLDFTPALVTVYTANSTEYILVPSLLALSSEGLTNRAVGAVEHIPANINRSLFFARPNITITSAVLQQSDNLTKISVTVKDNSNESVTLQHLMLKMTNGFKFSSYNISGNLSNNTKVNFRNAIKNMSNDMSRIGSQMHSIIGNLNHSIYANLSSINSSINVKFNLSGYNASTVRNTYRKMFTGIESRVHSQFNTVQEQMNRSFIAGENRINIMNRIMADMSLNFFIASNGSLFLPFSGFALFNMPLNVTAVKINRINSTNMSVSYPNSGISNIIGNNSSFSLPVNFGYALKAGSSVTLNFTGELNLGEGLVSLELLPLQYTLYVQGTNGARASYTVNATS